MQSKHIKSTAKVASQRTAATKQSPKPNVRSVPKQRKKVPGVLVDEVRPVEVSPFPTLRHPTQSEASSIAYCLAVWHHLIPFNTKMSEMALPTRFIPLNDASYGGTGEQPDVLGAVVHGILSSNTSTRNAERANASMTTAFGVRNWRGILNAPHERLVASLRCGGLANRKGALIRKLLEEVLARHNCLSLDHLNEPSLSDQDIVRELLSYTGVGPKVANAVCSMSLGRATMAVDTHILRLSKQIGWVPRTAKAEQARQHLDERIPGHLKYALHTLFIKHCKLCKDCSANGGTAGDMPTEWFAEGELSLPTSEPCPLRNFKSANVPD